MSDQSTMIVIADVDGATQTLNDACEVALGCTQAEAQGRPIWEVLAQGTWADALRTDVLEAAAGKTVPNQLGTWRGAQGCPLQVRWGYSTLHDPAGGIRGIAITASRLPSYRAVATDDAAPAQAGGADFRQVFRAMPGLHLLLANDLKIVDASQGYLRATLTTRAGIVGRDVFDVFPDNPDDPTASGVNNLRSSLFRVLATRQPDPMAFQKYDVRGPEGTFTARYWSPTNTPVLRSDGSVGCIVHTVEDVTELVKQQHEKAERIDFDREQRRLIERLREANRELAERHRERAQLQSELAHASRLTELGQTLSTLAHELSQPLASISTFLSAGARLLDAGGVDDAKSAITQAKRQADRAIQMMQRVRDFARHGQSERRPEALRQVVDEACALALVGAAAQAIDLRIELDPAIDRVWIDKIQIQQVLVNLIRNAVQAMAETPSASLAIYSATQADGVVQLGVADNGSGIPPEVRPRLFQPFVTSKPQGLGIGLSICSMIVEAHGGHLRCEDRPGGGTVFQLTLPSAQD